MADEKSKSTNLAINITGKASKKSLLKNLDFEARKQGISVRHYCGNILKKALTLRETFNMPLQSPDESPGEQFNVSVDEKTKEELKNWAKEKNRTLAAHVVFILEKDLEHFVKKDLS